MDEKNLPKIIYIGSDIGYWRSLSSKFSNIYTSQAFEFLDLYGKSASEIQKLIKLIRAHRPKVVFADLSQNSQEMLHVVRVLTRLNGVHKPFVMGLVDLKQSIFASQRAILSGVTCVHIKSVEQSSVVYNSMCFKFPDILIPHGFATAKLEDSIKGRVPSTISIVSEEGIRIESNLDLSLGERYPVHTRWSEKGIVKSPNMQCASSTQEDIYYNYKYAQELGFEFVDDVVIQEGMSEDDIFALEHERKKDLLDSQTLLRNWIDANKQFSKPKSLKILVIDKELNFYDGEKLTDEFPFVLRCQPYIKQVKEYLRKVLPQLIIFNYEEVSDEELELNQDISFTFNDSHSLKRLVKSLRSLNGYTPYIIIFNGRNIDTKRVQMNLNYSNIISYSEPLTTEMVLKMSIMLKDKLQDQNITFDDNTIFLDKDHSATYAELEIDMQLVAISENDLYFNSEIELDERTVIKLKKPVNMYISIAPPPQNSQVQSTYYAVIHTIGEVERSELRQFINSVFFRKHEEKKLEEKKAVEELKLKALTKKREELKKEKEEQEESKKKESEETNRGKK